MDKDYIDILSLLIKEKTYVSIKEIYSKINYKESLRNLQKKLRDLKNAFRISERGQASSTQYIVEEIQRHYPSSQFLYVYKNNIIIGLFFKMKDRYRFYYDNNYQTVA